MFSQLVSSSDVKLKASENARSEKEDPMTVSATELLKCSMIKFSLLEKTEILDPSGSQCRGFSMTRFA